MKIPHKKNFVSEFAQIWVFFEKKIFDFFFNFYLMLEDPRKILMSKISNFFEQSSRYSQNQPKAPKILQELLSKDSKRIQKNPKDSKRLKFPKDFKRFQEIPKIPRNSKRLQKFQITRVQRIFCIQS